MSSAIYDEALNNARGAWATTERAGLGAIALAILALVEELREQRLSE